MQENCNHLCKKSCESLPEVSSLVGELVVEQGAGMLVGTAAQVADVRPLV